MPPTRFPSLRLFCKPVVCSALLLIIACLALYPLKVYAATIQVDGSCTLPEAIDSANNDDVGATGCVFAGAAGDDTILINGTQNFTSGPNDGNALPSIASNITINGGAGGATIQRSGGNPFRFFQINSGTLTLEHVTLRNGHLGAVEGGGAIYANPGTQLTLINSTLISNSADFGGALDIFGAKATLLNSQVISNTSSRFGGAIVNENFSTLLITNTQFTGNQSGFENGAGGAIENSQGTLLVANSSFTANRAGLGGAIFNELGSVATISGSTFSDNTASAYGGVIENNAVVTVTKSILSGNHNIGGSVFYQSGEAASSKIEQSCIANNEDIALYYSSGSNINAKNNWWGKSDGPSGAGSGGGDSVGDNVDFAPFLASAPAGCVEKVLPKLALTVSEAPAGQLLPGQPVTLTVAIKNTGTVDASGFGLAENFSDAFVLDHLVPSDLLSEVGFNQYALAPLPAGQTTRQSYVGMIDASLTASTVLSHTSSLVNVSHISYQAGSSNPITPSVITWSSSAYTTSEAGGDFNAFVTMSPANPYNTVRMYAYVKYPSESYWEELGVVAFPPNSIQQAVTIPRLNDNVVTGDQTFYLDLQYLKGAQYGTPSFSTLTVREDDAPGITVTVSSDNHSAKAGDVLTFGYQVTNTGILTITSITAKLTNTGQGAAASTSMELASNLLPGQSTSGTLSYTVVSGDLPGPLEKTVAVIAKASTGSSATASSQVTVPLQMMEMRLPFARRP